MQKLISLLIGPELFWVVCYLIVLLLIRLTGSPVKSMDGFWENTIYIIPFLIVPLSFFIYGMTDASKGWFILRLWIAGIVGGHLVMNKCLTAYSEQGPGIGMGYLVGMLLVLIVLVVGTVVAVFRW